MVDHPLPVASAGPPTEEDLGFNLGVSSADLAVRPWLRLDSLSGLWLLASVVLAVTAVYHVTTGAASWLAWTAAGTAVALFAGASWLRRIQLDTSSTTWWSVGGLVAFAAPLGQVLLVMVQNADAGATVLVLLLLVGYALVAPSMESLLAYLTLSLGAWTACMLRLPTGAWQPHVLPWFAATALALLVLQRRGRTLSWFPRHLPRRPSSSQVDLDREQQVQTLTAARDAALARCRQLEEQAPFAQDPRSEEDLFFLQECTRALAQDVTLNEVGASWLERLGSRVGARQTSLWLGKDGQFKLVLGLTEAGAADVEALLTRASQAGTLIHSGDACAVPLDLGLHGRSVLLLQGCPDATSATLTRLLHTCGAALNLFLRWQLADGESESLTEQLHQEQEKHRQQREADRAEAEHWNSEAERRRLAQERAQGEIDTLQQLLTESEAEVKRARADGAGQARLQDQLRQTAAELEAATTGWQQTEDQLRESEAARQRAEEEARDAVDAWQHESQSAARLTLAVRGLADAVAVFDAAGELLYENDAAQALRGPIRHRPGAHPLWQAVTPESRTVARRDGHWHGEVYVPIHPATGQTYQVSVRAAKTGSEEYAIIAHQAVSEAERRRERAEIDAARADAAGAATRFFSGLVRTLRPPVTRLLEQAERLLENAGDPDLRRDTLCGIVQHTRHVRGFLTQVFDYAELEAGAAASVKTKLSPWQVVHDVARSFREAAEAKGVRLTIVARGPLPPLVLTDGDRLRLALSNLFSFAAQAAPRGDLTVWAALEEQSPVQSRTPRLLLGIDLHSFTTTTTPPEHLFEPLSEPSAMALPLARRQVQALGGTVHAERISPRGLRLVLALPVSAVEQASLLPSDQLPLNDEPDGPESPTLLHGRVLVVLAHHEAQRVVTFHLERFGLRTEVAADSTAALARLRETDFAAILWDADLSPLAALDQLRGYPGAIFMLSAQPGEPAAFLAAGGHGVLNMPVAPALWRQTLARCLPSIESDDTAGPALRSEFHGDTTFVPLVRAFVIRLPGLLAELRAALQVADLAGLARAVHTLADNARLYGYPPLADAAHAVETALLRGADSHHLSTTLDTLSEITHQITRGLRITPLSGNALLSLAA